MYEYHDPLDTHRKRIQGCYGSLNITGEIVYVEHVHSLEEEPEEDGDVEHVIYADTNKGRFLAEEVDPITLDAGMYTVSLKDICGEHEFGLLGIDDYSIPVVVARRPSRQWRVSTSQENTLITPLFPHVLGVITSTKMPMLRDEVEVAMRADGCRVIKYLLENSDRSVETCLEEMNGGVFCSRVTREFLLCRSPEDGEYYVFVYTYPVGIYKTTTGRVSLFEGCECFKEAVECYIGVDV
jgi:hypothetical protein